jgi:CRP-like cAMP-binding protein
MASDYKGNEASSDSLKQLFEAANLFTEFPDILLQQLRQVTSVVNFDPENKIISQGELNHNLYFLVLGTVKVFVDDGLVATMVRKGDLLGEMSVITKKPAGATIIAETPVQLIKVDTEAFKKITGRNTDQLDHILYRIYSMILTDKLTITNQKAKVLEDMTDALRRTKTEMQEINRSLEARVAERTTALGGRLEELLTQHLSPLRSTMETLKDKIPAGSRTVFEKCLGQVDGVVRLVQPMIINLRSEVSVKNKKVLITDSDKKQLLVCKMAMGGTGVTLQTSSDVLEAEKLVQENDYDLILASVDMLNILKIAKLRSPKTKIVFMSSEPIPSYLPKIHALGVMPNIVSRDENDKPLTIRNVMSTVTKLAGPNIFGLEKYLNLGAEIHELPITKSSERANLRTKMMEHFVALGIRKSVIDTVGTVLEELLMNAIYDAPIDAVGRSLYNHLPRTHEVELRDHEQGRFRFACDGEHVAISVEDPFGALTAKTTLKYLEKCYGGGSANDEAEMQGHKGGAGRGLHQIIENSDLVVFNISPRQRTEVIAFFGMIPGHKSEKLPQLHFFEQT